MLLEREAMDPLLAVERLAGLQAQTPHTWYIGLWSRLDPFDPVEVGELITDRRAVRIALMRSTIHLMSAADALWVRPLVAPAIARTLTHHAGPLRGVDLGAVASAARAVLEAEPLTAAALGHRLLSRWPHSEATALAQAARANLGLVQVPPRGVWGRSGPAAYTTIEHWLAKPQGPVMPMETLVMRYLAAFGPATTADAQAWSGLSRLDDVFARLRPDLAVFTTEDGREVFDLPDAPRPDPDIPAPVRLLYEHDNLLRAHSDRSRFHKGPSAPVLWSGEGPIPGTVLVDGLIAGTWTLAREGRAVQVRVRPLGRMTKADRALVREEAESLMAVLTPRATSRDVVIGTG